MIACGWCGKPTEGDRCIHCRHRDPAAPWLHRGEEPPNLDPVAGRPHLDAAVVAHRLASVRDQLGPNPTVETLAEALDVSPRTARRWLAMAGYPSVSALAPSRG